MSLNELVRDIKAYLARRNADPKPYTWKAEGAEILAKIKRAPVLPLSTPRQLCEDF